MKKKLHAMPLKKHLCSDFDTEICYLERFNFAKSQTRTAAILLSCPDMILHDPKMKVLQKYQYLNRKPH